MNDEGLTGDGRDAAPAADAHPRGLFRRALWALIAWTPWGRIRDIRTLRDELQADFAARFGSRLDLTELRLDAVEQNTGRRLDVLEKDAFVRIDTLEAAVRAMQAEVAALASERLAGVDRSLDALDAAARGLSSEVERLRDRVVPAVVARGDAIIDRLADEVDEVGSLLERSLRREPLPAPEVADAEPAFAAELARVQPLLVETFRGSEAEIAGRLDHWLPDLAESAPVLDLGCGRGELLLLLRDAGVAATGVEGDPALVQSARRRGLDVLEGDVLEVLRSQADASAGAVTAIHLAEHLAPGRLLATLTEARRVLRPGGLLLVESPDPRTLRVGASLFWIDPTHQRPLLPETLELFLAASGFEIERRERLHPFPEDQRLLAAAPELPAELAGDAGRVAARLEALEGRLDELVNGPRDFAVIARRPRADDGGD